MAPVTLKPPPLPRQDSRRALAAVGAVAAAMVLLLPLSALMSGPAFVPRLTVVNPTPYELNVLTSGPSDDGWLDLGAVPREREQSVEEVADQGDKWTFRFSSAGVFAGEMEVPRSELERTNWRVTVPPGTVAPLQAAGLAPSAR